MFKRLNKKIQIIISITMTIGIVISASMAYNSMKNVIYKHYKMLVIQYIEQANKNARLYMNLIEETTKYFASDPLLLTSLDNRNFDIRIISVLDGLRSSSLNILGVSLYTSTGFNYTSSNVSNVPSIEWLEKNEFPPFFIDQENQKSYWIIRYKSLHEFYHSYYNRKEGLFSYLCKVNATNERAIGYLLVDTDINTLYDFYENNEDNFFQNKNHYIITDDDHVLATSKKPIPALEDAFNTGTYDGIQITEQTRNHLVVSSPIPSCNADIIMYISLGKINNRFLQLGIILISLSIIFIFLSIITARSLAYSISAPLNTLYYKMEDFL